MAVLVEGKEIVEVYERWKEKTMLDKIKEAFKKGIEINQDKPELNELEAVHIPLEETLDIVLQQASELRRKVRKEKNQLTRTAYTEKMRFIDNCVEAACYVESLKSDRYRAEEFATLALYQASKGDYEQAARSGHEALKIEKRTRTTDLAWKELVDCLDDLTGQTPAREKEREQITMSTCGAYLFYGTWWSEEDLEEKVLTPAWRDKLVTEGLESLARSFSINNSGSTECFELFVAGPSFKPILCLGHSYTLFSVFNYRIKSVKEQITRLHGFNLRNVNEEFYRVLRDLNMQTIHPRSWYFTSLYGALPVKDF